MRELIHRLVDIAITFFIWYFWAILAIFILIIIVAIIAYIPKAGKELVEDQKKEFKKRPVLTMGLFAILVVFFGWYFTSGINKNNPTSNNFLNRTNLENANQETPSKCFNYQKAKQAGYSDEEIYKYLDNRRTENGTYPFCDSSENQQYESATYINNRFGFAIDYPKSWTIGKEAKNSDGLNLYDVNGIEILVYGTYTPSNFSQQEDPTERDIIELRDGRKATELKFVDADSRIRYIVFFEERGTQFVYDVTMPESFFKLYEKDILATAKTLRTL